MVGAELLSGLDRSMRRHGLGETDFRALVMLFSRPDGRANPSELCGFDTHSRANMTRIGDALVARGLVTRAPAAEDRRRIVLSITPKGRRLVRTLIPQVAPLVSAVLGGLGQTQKRQLATTLKRIAVNIDAHAGGLSK
jgi:MarR family transcriptional repressor of emrRAB